MDTIIAGLIADTHDCLIFAGIIAVISFCLFTIANCEGWRDEPVFATPQVRRSQREWWQRDTEIEDAIRTITFARVPDERLVSVVRRLSRIDEMQKTDIREAMLCQHASPSKKSPFFLTPFIAALA
jgi:hypothetical protein